MFRIIANLFRKREKEIVEATDRLNGPLAQMKLSSSLEKNIGVLKDLFRDVDIMRYKMIESAGDKPVRYCVAFTDGLVDSAIINDNIIKPLMLSPVRPDDDLIAHLLENVIQTNEAVATDNFQCIVEDVTYGNTVLFVEGLQSGGDTKYQRVCTSWNHRARERKNTQRPRGTDLPSR